MVYAHSINLDWLDGSEYHIFLLWIVRNMAGLEGYKGLNAGQVRFSRRELEHHLGIGHTRASGLIQKAVCDGLLSPLTMSQNRKGMGEIYDTLAELRQTRICPGPTTDQQRFLSGPFNRRDKRNNFYYSASGAKKEEEAKGGKEKESKQS